MAILVREQLRGQLKRREFAPVYLLFGEETYLRDLAAKTIADLVLADCELREFNEAEHSLIDSRLSHALADAEQLPMMSPRRVVTVTNFVTSGTANSEEQGKDDDVFLDTYLTNPSETTVLIITADNIDKRRKIVKSLLDKAVVVGFSRLNDGELVTWAKSKFAELNSTVEEKAVRQLVNLVGNDVRRLTNEIAKLSAAALPDALVTIQLVESAVSNTREMTNFELTDSLFEKNKSKTLVILKKILDDGAEPLMLLGLIASNYHKLLIAKSMMQNGSNKSEVLSLIKLPYFKHDDFLASARRSNTSELAQAIKKISETDLAIKSSVGGGGKAGSRLQIELLVCKLLVD